MKYINLTLILTYILALLVILQCYSLLSMILPNRYFYLSILAVIGILLLHEKRIKINKKSMFLICTYVVGVSFLFTGSYFRNIEFLCCVLLAFPLFILYAENEKNRYNFFEAYTNIMTIIAALSIFFFVFGSLLGIIKPTGYYPQSRIGWGPNNYYDFYHLYCEGQEVAALGYVGTRNIAIFVEGPMLTYTICFALFYELFFRKDGIRKSVLAIILTTILTSLSTTGMIVAIVLIYIKFYDVIKKYKNLRLLLIPILLIVAVYVTKYVISDKFASNAGSASVRTDDILTCLRCFSKNIIDGVGYQNMSALGEYRSLIRANAGLSTGVGGILAYGGLLWGVWYLIPVCIAIKQYIVHKESRCYTGFVIMALFLLVFTVVQSRVLCTIVNAVCWLFIMRK